ncbi:glycosyltransferase [Phycicoccus sp. M110.8]|uniref:glycosyltransferase n=1 Tax=Phycicoccus sp. M110.8 TaxID=3075433 RepID=UPI0028FDA431|nr:glycosyltransferase [Phycicoccus sp. M110.8]MDU0314728.1 glycosyltransferase [Phycicoccus sp. M110.8]
MVVLMAAYNGMRFIAPQVDSILGQFGVEITLVVSVDDSTDGTREWVEALVQRDARVQMMPSPGRLGSAAANFFRLMSEVSVDSYDYVALADQDDIWLPGKVDRAVDVLSRHDAAGYSSSVWSWSEDGSVSLVDKAGRQREWDHLFSSPGPGCTHVLRADVFMRLQQVLLEHRRVLTEVEYHDWLDYAFVRENGWDWYIDTEPQMLYRQHDSNQIGANRGLGAKVRRVAQLRRGWMWEQAAAVIEVVGAQEAMPARLMKQRGLGARLRLAAVAPKCRRRRIDAGVLALSFLFTERPTVESW